MHKLVDLWQLLEIDRLEGCVDETACEEGESLLRVLSVADVRGLDANHLEHRLEDWCSDVCTGRQTNDDDGTSGSNVFCGLLEGLLVHSHEDDGMGAQTIRGSSADILGDVARFGEIDESLSCC